MSTKEWVSNHRDGASLYQECFYDGEKHEINPNPAVIQIDNPKRFSITREKLVDIKPFSQLVVEIPAVRFDEIAKAWCKTRHLNTNKYTLEELLAKCDFAWPVSEKELIIGLEKDCLRQEELSVDNIFDAATDDKDDALQLEPVPDELIKQRNASELNGLFKGGESLSKINSAAKSILSHIKAEQSIDDEESMIGVIEQALKEIVIAEIIDTKQECPP